jgi:SAM-dependent methyltransferase
MSRLLDFVHDGDRVLDIGTGYGYVATMLHRERRLAHYCGVDLAERYLSGVREGMRANGLDAAAMHLELLDLLDLTREFVARHRPSVAIVLEVLEHVRDVDRAFAALGGALGPDTDLLFTVPMNRRIETVWGHASLFDVARVQRLCSGAGLVLHHLEPLHNVWMLGLASASGAVPERLTAAAATPAPAPPAEPASHYVFRNVATRGERGLASLAGGADGVAAGEDGLTWRGDGAAAMEIDAAAPAVVRIELAVSDPGGVDLVLTGTGAGGELVAWTFGPEALREAPRTYVLRPGESQDGIEAQGTAVEARAVTRLRLGWSAQRPATVTLGRLAYVPGSA